MNYQREINAFVDWLETNPLDAITQALWFHLMAINNKCNSPQWFAVANLTLQAKLGVDKKTVIRHRNILIQKRLIAYKNQGRAAGRYRMLPVSARMGKAGEDNGENMPHRGEQAVNTGGNIPPGREPAGNNRGIIPLNRGPNTSIGGDAPPNRPPDRGLIRGPNLTPLNKQNNNQTNNKHIYDIFQTVFQHWNAQRLVTHRRLSPGQRQRIEARLDEGYTVDEILAAIDNYAAVVHGDQYYWTHKWGLDEFLLRGLDKFKTESDPRTNFLRDQYRAPGRAQAGADKYAGYINRTVGYDDL